MERSMVLASLLASATWCVSEAASSWISLEKGVEFRPSDESMNDPKLQSLQTQHLRQLWGRQYDLQAPADSIFVDGTETYYDEYAQAWRFLGFYQDCDACADGSVDCVGNTICQRYALWAAYVDTRYEGNGAGEYMYYNRHTGSWNKDACKAASSSRCVKMDCHESTTHWSLLGIFKEAQYDAFLNSILQFQGDCVWNDDEYKFMQAVGGNGVPFPTECTAVENDGDEELYYDTQPSAGGNMNVALYTDNQCTQPYTGDAISIDDVMAPTVASSMNEEMKAFNKALDAFKICQPCKAADIVSMIHKKTVVNINGDRYGGNAAADNNAENGDDNAQNENNNGGFVCSAAVDDNSVNQCEVFRQNTKMQTASYSDIVLAESQGTVGGIHVGTTMLGEPHKKKHMWLSILLFLASLVLLIYAFMRLYHEDRINSELKEPLVEQQSNKKSRCTDSNNESSTRSIGNNNNDTANSKRNVDDASVKTSGENNQGSKRSFWGRKRSQK